MPTIEVLPTADITVGLIGQKAGSKMAYVKDATTEQFYSIFPDMKGQFSKGMRCKVEYSARPKDDGSGEWRTIKKIVGNQSAPTPGPKNDYRARSNPAEAKQIAVLALAKECIAKTDLPLSTDVLVAILNMCSAAYDRTLGGVQAQRRDDLDDSIEY